MTSRRRAPLLCVRGLTKRFGAQVGCLDVGFDLWPGEVLGVVGESGSGKTTLLDCLAGRLAPTAGSVESRDARRRRRRRAAACEAGAPPAARAPTGASSTRTRATACAWASRAGANVGERLMAVGRAALRPASARPALDWLDRVEIDADRIDDLPETFSGGMQQRLQIARNLVTRPRLVFMDEPTGGLDVSVQARLLDLLRGPRRRPRPLRHHRHPRPRRGAPARAPAAGDAAGARSWSPGSPTRCSTIPQHPYTQLLVSSVLPAMSGPAAGGRRSRARPSPSTRRAASRCRCCADVSLGGRAGRVRGAGRPVRRGQEHAAARVYGNYRPQAGRILVRHGEARRRHGRGRAAHGARGAAAARSATSASSCASFRACRPLDVVAEPLRALGASARRRRVARGAPARAAAASRSGCGRCRR